MRKNAPILLEAGLLYYLVGLAQSRFQPLLIKICLSSGDQMVTQFLIHWHKDKAFSSFFKLVRSRFAGLVEFVTGSLRLLRYCKL